MLLVVFFFSSISTVSEFSPAYSWFPRQMSQKATEDLLKSAASVHNYLQTNIKNIPDKAGNNKRKIKLALESI